MRGEPTTAAGGGGGPDTSRKVTLGPLLYHWTTEQYRDFYAKVADEAPVDVVYLGEVACSKREPYLVDVQAEVAERLDKAGKEVVRSAPFLVVSERERSALASLTDDMADELVEANDLGCVGMLKGRPHALGPGVNIYNESSLRWHAKAGARSVCLNAELPRRAVAAIAGAAQGLGVEIEVQVFGRAPLAISSRCYHARSRGLHKDGCGFACAEDPDGMVLETMDGMPFLAVDGTLTVTDTFLNLGGDLSDLARHGVSRFRLWPHTNDMVTAACLVRKALDGAIGDVEVAAALRALVPGGRVSNGFYHASEGWRFLEAPRRRAAQIARSVRSAATAHR